MGEIMNKLQESILNVALKLDEICKKYEITYYIMGGTALGAIRHGGFIPWDDDIDVFMTPADFEKFRTAVEMENNDEYFIETVGLSDRFVEYAKFRKKNTTCIENGLLRKGNEIHHNVFVDIMLLRKCPNKVSKRKRLYKMSQLVSFLTISDTGWSPKKGFHKFAKKIARFLPKKFIAEYCLKRISKYESLENFDCYAYFMSRVGYNQGIFKKELFAYAEDIPFESVKLSAPCGIKEYLTIRYGNYMALPPEDKRVGEHAFFFDGEKDYTEYIEDFTAKYVILSLRRELSEKGKELFSKSSHVYETHKAYASGGEITELEGLSAPLSAVLIQGSSDMRILRRMLAKMKKSSVAVFDITCNLSERGANKLIKALKKHGITTVTEAQLKERLHGKI